MNKPELQARILTSSVRLFTLASAIDRLPDSETRGELIYKHNRLELMLANLQADLEFIDRNACYFALTNKCSGKVCCECEYLLGE
ncbi:hypothetical protein KKF82_07975 [Patescibacteria group bacterium]|uniref:Uncharacterized protein n=1 Tax=viral metagenome TaxID=1070528 RepID=A0A6M3M8C2_9ZZZZ|nr:hypothetical protein [Patescibacteria group bacterium]